MSLVRVVRGRVGAGEGGPAIDLREQAPRPRPGARVVAERLEVVAQSRIGADRRVGAQRERVAEHRPRRSIAREVQASEEQVRARVVRTIALQILADPHADGVWTQNATMRGSRPGRITRVPRPRQPSSVRSGAAPAGSSGATSTRSVTRAVLGMGVRRK